MIIALLQWVYTSFLCFLLGLAVLKLSLHCFGKRVRRPGFFHTCIAGLGAVLLGCNAGSLFFPLGPPVHAAIVLLALLAGWYIRSEGVGMLLHQWRDLCAAPRTTYLLQIAITIVILIWASGPPLVFDTGLYHAQAVHWYEEHPAVPGLANLHSRLGVPSAWFAANACFGTSRLLAEPRHLLNGMLAWWTALWLLKGVQFGKCERNSTAFLAGAFLLVYLFYFKGSYSCPSPDLPVTLLTWMLLLTMLRTSREELRQPSEVTILLVLTTLTLVTVKLTAFPVLLCMLVVLWSIDRGQRPALAVFIAAAAAVTWGPWLAQNAILSGYLIFPVPSLGLPVLDWKVPVERVAAFRETVESWARTGGLTHHTFAEWFPEWLRHQQGETLVLLAIVLVSAVVVAALPLWSKDRHQLGRGARAGLIPYGIALAGIGFWFLMAPDPRFGQGFIGFAAAWSLAKVMEVLVANRPAVMSGVLALCFLAGIVIGLQKIGRQSARLAYCVFPAPYNRVPMREVHVGDCQVWIPVEGQLGHYSPFPSTPWLEPGVELRGSHLRSGFRISKDPAHAN